MKLTDFIDFSIFSDSIEPLLVSEDITICEKDPKHYSCMDKEIDQVDKDIGVNLIFDARESFDEYVKLKDIYIGEYYDLYDKVETLFFKSTDHKFYLMYLNLDYYSDTYLMIGIFERQTGKYLIVGVDGEHLFIKNNEFNFYDTDGFGDCDRMGCDIFGDSKKYITLKSKPMFILDVINEYYETICDNGKFTTKIDLDTGKIERKPLWS